MTYPIRYPSRKKSSIVSGLNTGTTMIQPNANLLNSTYYYQQHQSQMCDKSKALTFELEQISIL